jgi:hypothetical protein
MLKNTFKSAEIRLGESRSLEAYFGTDWGTWTLGAHVTLPNCWQFFTVRVYLGPLTFALGLYR